MNLAHSSLYFCTGIKKEPNKFFVPRTVMIGGKVRSWATERGSQPLMSRLLHEKG